MKINWQKIKNFIIESDDVPAPAVAEPVVAEEPVVEEVVWEEAEVLEEPVPEEPIPEKETLQLAIGQFRDCRDVATKVLDGHPVFVDFSSLDYTDAKRALDFLGGVIFAIGGTLQPISETVFFFAQGEKREEAELREIYKQLVG